MSTVTTEVVRLGRSALRRGLLPPAPDPRFGGADYVRLRYKGRIFALPIMVLINLVTLVQLRRGAIFDHAVGTRAEIYVLASLVVDFVITVAFMRRPNRFFHAAIVVAAVIETSTIVGWVQLTGLLSSYYLTMPYSLVVLQRLIYGYWCSLAAMVTWTVIYLAAFVLENKGLLPYAPLLRQTLGSAYADPEFRTLAVFSITLVNFLAFPMVNVIAYLLQSRDIALQDARRDLRRVVEQARIGRLSGTRLGDYAVEDLLGRGGMGEVYAARGPKPPGDVAIKLLHAHLGGDEKMRMRFRREAEVVGKMPPGTVAKVYQFGTNEEGYDYLIMERLRGEDLGALLKRRERLELDEVVGLVAAVARGLDAAHAQGVVHRDLKPQNLFLCGELERGAVPDVRLLDFGVARLHEAAAAQMMTATAAVLGTPGYMPPEQASGGKVGPPADTFALGAIAYRALTGKPAFASRSPQGALFEALHHHAAPPSESVGGLPADVDDVLEIALAKDPGLRYQRASELAEDLQAAARGALSPESRARAAKLCAMHTEPAGTMTAG